MEAVVVTTGAIRRAKLKWNRHHQQTNTQLFTGWMPFLSPNQQCQSTEWKKCHIPLTCSPKLTWGLPALSLTTNGSWLPGKPLISPLMAPKVKVKVRTLDIAPLRESSPQKHSGVARVLKGSHSFTCTPTCSIRNRNEPYLPVPNSFTQRMVVKWCVFICTCECK